MERADSRNGRGGFTHRFRSGGWYFLVVIGSVGLLSAIPFWHSASRLGRVGVRNLAIIYSIAGAVVLVLAASVPRDPVGEPVGSLGRTLNAVFVISALVLMGMACYQLRSLRREVYGLGRRIPTSSDPAIARVLAARARREEARRLWDRDPAMARELGVGRPDLGRGFDDGGLVDVNTAPIDVLASVCGLERADATRIVAARAQRGMGYYNVGEVLMDVDLPVPVQEQLRERLIC